ncbi:hypothetical protein D8S78_24665 [Natrialba swarupiae]|nr:hypothetical protein [Natrialba swarupiae]
MTTDETPIPNEYYEQLIPLIRAVESLRESTAFEHDLSAGDTPSAACSIRPNARLKKPGNPSGPEPGAETNYQREPDEFDDYEDALTQIERRLGRLLQCARNEHPTSTATVTPRRQVRNRPREHHGSPRSAAGRRRRERGHDRLRRHQNRRRLRPRRRTGPR